MTEGTPVRRVLSIAVGSFDDPERELVYAPEPDRGVLRRRCDGDGLDTVGRTLDTVEVPGRITALCAHPRGYLLVETTEEVICFAHSSVPA